MSLRLCAKGGTPLLWAGDHVADFEPLARRPPALSCHSVSPTSAAGGAPAERSFRLNVPGKIPIRSAVLTSWRGSAGLPDRGPRLLISQTRRSRFHEQPFPVREQRNPHLPPLSANRATEVEKAALDAPHFRGPHRSSPFGPIDALGYRIGRSRPSSMSLHRADPHPLMGLCVCRGVVCAHPR